ncbi:hypothetical protein GE21DRAFT_2144 [Neurospora crassa]|uniref:Non-anchored cell wall protein 6 n=2 Tax=Neurospora crassa TaxID=5141 RepID=V5IRF3_NEUCR|nr:non-anchored cell wall protein 6, variant 1 [Neurospora crassa OR74A]XP_011392787.1 non-anchored cell wall protein 6 [Neurospora crassa OR74A]XP_011392788.1 non-anchored cell wall protein 6, variant 2 [Neurospora crassa OR74A]KHE89888.1 hypothetical protein GE21DRAFT_2144 [Neurospora crassa]ESA44313.1 non-anchored cell wall protein 6 [Neurospora crassa OR74A]ESA44314.1 non-anchored cell wall protein 6, variant 1 [Neurospora crassa OR74A]ESA44315.1 non-anchored cell wall protein 6, variant |eukprot:XP_011392786.1 non-anchored cell wall protein 6, variant 1 [Neurospora crassa OR74A]
MNKSRPLLALLSLFFIAISLILLWFVILSGITRTSPLRQTYFLRADTSGISGARDVSQWTYFKVCGLNNLDCGPARPALPLGDAWDSNPAGAPAGLTGKYGGHTTSHYFWYMWRFGWVFFLLALFFETLAFFSGFLACLGRVGAAVSGMIASLALVMFSIAVSLMTATFVKMRNHFHRDGREAHLGRYAFGFAWGAWAALAISTVLFLLAMLKRDKNHYVNRRATYATEGHDHVVADGPVTGPSERRKRGVFNWGRRSNSGKSFDGRRVKDDY